MDINQENRKLTETEGLKQILNTLIAKKIIKTNTSGDDGLTMIVKLLTNISRGLEAIPMEVKWKKQRNKALTLAL